MTFEVFIIECQKANDDLWIATVRHNMQAITTNRGKTALDAASNAAINAANKEYVGLYRESHDV